MLLSRPKPGTEVLRPPLADREGDALFIGTPHVIQLSGVGYGPALHVLLMQGIALRYVQIAVSS